MAAELSMNGKKKIETLQKEFTQKFPYLTLVFLDKARRAVDISKSLSEVREAKGDDISIVASLKVNTLEKRFLDNYGLIVEVAYQKSDKVVYTKDTVDKTLNELNKWCEANDCQPFEFKKSFTGNTLSSVQEQIYESIKEHFPNAEAKKINKDNFLDIYIPEINKKRGTHLFFNTAKDGIKIGFYCRDEEFIASAIKNSSNIEQYAQGIRILKNPVQKSINDAIASAVDFIGEILGSKSNLTEVSEEEIENSNESNSNNTYNLKEFLGIIESKTEKSQFEIIAYKNTLQEWEELYTVHIEDITVGLKITRRYYDSYWKAMVSRDELLGALEYYDEEKDLDIAFDDIEWIFFKDGEGYNEVEMELFDYDYDALPSECWKNDDKDSGELDAFKVYSNYPSTLEEEEELTKGNFGSITINFDSQEIFKLKSISF